MFEMSLSNVSTNRPSMQSSMDGVSKRIVIVCSIYFVN